MKQVEAENLPLWFEDIERIDWPRFAYVYDENVDVVGIFRIILLGTEMDAVKSLEHLMGEIEHQSNNYRVANFIIPFFIKMIEDNVRPTAILEVVANGLAVLTENIYLDVRGDAEGITDCYLCNDEKLLCENHPDPKHADSLQLLWQSRSVYLERIQAKPSYYMCEGLGELLISLLVCRKFTKANIAEADYTAICDNIFMILNDEACDQYVKRALIGKLVELAEFDTVILQTLRDWAQSQKDRIWASDIVAFAVAGFQNGAYATQKEIKYRDRRIGFSFNGLCMFFRFRYSRKNKILWRDRMVHYFPWLKYVFKSPF